jgi:hypothetical protein
VTSSQRAEGADHASADVGREALAGAAKIGRVDTRQIVPQKLIWPTVKKPTSRMPQRAHPSSQGRQEKIAGSRNIRESETATAGGVAR